MDFQRVPHTRNHAPSLAGFVVSRIPGRLRLRHDVLRAPERNRALRADVAGWEGVVSVDGNPAAGSVLIHYDPAILPPAAIEARLAERLDAVPGTRRTHRHRRKNAAAWKDINVPVKAGMLASLAVSLLALGTSRRLHAGAGALYLGFLLLHLAAYRRTLLS